MITVQFQNIGPTKASWSQQFKRADVDAFAVAIVCHRAALIRGKVWCEDGIVYAGITKVGTYSVTE